MLQCKTLVGSFMDKICPQFLLWQPLATGYYFSVPPLTSFFAHSAFSPFFQGYGAILGCWKIMSLLLENSMNFIILFLSHCLSNIFLPSRHTKMYSKIMAFSWIKPKKVDQHLIHLETKKSMIWIFMIFANHFLSLIF